MSKREPGQPPDPPDRGGADDPDRTSAFRPGARAGQGVFTPSEILADRYRVIRLIGKGGMGEVYEVADRRLRVRVALKTIREKAASRSSFRERFKREVLLARSISHPNVCRIFDLGVHGPPSEEILFLTMELLEGETLEDRIQRVGRIREAEAGPIVSQIALGLQAAHDAGVLHRDLKSSNIILVKGRSRERAVITDFGLARGTTAEWAEASRMTGTGMVVGTFAYMAPEQMQGEATSPATDLYTLGVVMYEMVTGALPFDGDSPMEIMNRRMASDPAPPRGVAPDLDPVWEATILRCLNIDPAARFACAIDVVKALGLPEPAASPLPAYPAEPVEEGAGLADSSSSSASTIGARPAVYAPTAIREPPSMRVSPWIVAGLAAAVLAAVAFLLYQRTREKPVPSGTPRQLTSTEEWEGEPAISPEGTLIAFVSGEDGQSSIWVIDAKGGDPLRLTNEPAAEDRAPSWFPDSSTIAFASDRGGEWGIWKVPRLGGPALPLIPNATEPAVSPDGKEIAFTRSTTRGAQRIWVAPLDHPEDARMLSGDDGGLWGHERPVWSPDGAVICYEDFANLWTVPARGGKARPLTAENATDFNPTWSGGGRYVFFSSLREGTLALWRVPFPGGGPAVRLTMGTGPEDQPTVSGDGSRLSYSTYVERADLILLNRQTGESVRLAGRRSECCPALSPDGRAIVFVSGRQGKPDLWSQPLAGIHPDGEPNRLTDLPGTTALPAFSPDGRFIAFHRVIEGERDIWVMQSAGGLPQRFTDSPGADIQPAWSPDGLWLAFASERGGGNRIWVAPVRDGRPAGPARQVTGGAMECFFPVWLSDGVRLAFVGTAEDERDVFVVPVDGSFEPRAVTSGAGARILRSGPGGTLFVSGLFGGSQVSLRQVWPDTGRSEPVGPGLDFGASPQLGQFDASADGLILAAVSQEAKGDLWVVDAAQGSF